MKKKGFIILGIVIVLIVLLIDSITPKKVIWTQTYNEKKTHPFDLKVFYDQLDSIFKQEKVKTIKSTFYEYYQEHSLSTLKANNIYMNIDRQYQLDLSSEHNLLTFIGNGNIAFISANRFSNSLLDSLNIRKNYKTKSLLMVDSLKTSINKNVDFLKYEKKLKNFQTYFKDSTNITSLGKISLIPVDTSFVKKTNFIKVKYKKGLFYLHTQPEIFTNYYLLSATNTDYINQVLSIISKKDDTKNNVYFHSNFSSDDDLANSPLRFIKKQKELNAAWILLLTGIGLFLLINAKRKQRIIPIIPKVRNTSLDFVETIAILYEEADNFQPIIQHKINIFYKNIRNTYNIVTDNTNPKLVAQLSLKSGYDFAKTKELIRFVNTLKSRETSSITLLKKLNKDIEDFNKNTNAWKS